MAWSPDDNAVEHLARFGYGARGFVYLVVGALALLAALGSGGQARDSEGALRFVLHGPLGVGLVGLLAIGLSGFALWRFVEALTDADRRGTSWKALAVRGAHLVSALIYGGSALSAARLAFGIGQASAGGDSVKDGTAWLLDQPFGPWLVALVGFGVIAAALAYGGKAWTGHVADRLALPTGAGGWVCPIGRFGYAARGAAFLVIGGFLLVAAWRDASSEAEGLSGAFAAMRAQPYGGALLALVAAGHVAFGVFGMIQARYRGIDAPDFDETDDALKHAARSLTENAASPR